MKINKILVIVAVVFALLRFVNLGNIPIFFDEAIYLSEGAKITQNIHNLFIAFEGVQFPIMTWILAIVNILTKNFASLLITGRITSVILDFGAAVFVFLIGRKIIGKTYGLISILIYLSLPLIFLHSRFVMLESPTNFFSLGLIYFALRSLNSNNLKNKLAIIAFGLLAFFTKPIAIVYFPAAFLLPLLGSRNNLINQYKKILPFFAILCVIILAIFIPLASHFSAHTKVVTGVGVGTIIYDFKMNLHRSWLWSVGYLTPSIIIFSALSFLIGVLKKKPLVVWLAIWIFSVIILDSLVGEHFYPRHLYPLGAPMAMLTGFLVYELRQTSKILSIIVLITILLSAWNLNYALLENPKTAMIGEDRQQFFENWSSGVGIQDVSVKLQSLSSKEKITVYTENDDLMSWALPTLFNSGDVTFWSIDNLPKKGNGTDFIVLNRQWELSNSLNVVKIKNIDASNRRPIFIYQYISK